LSWQACVRSAEPTAPRCSGLRQPGVARRGHPDRGRHLPAQRLYGRRRQSPEPSRCASPPGQHTVQMLMPRYKSYAATVTVPGRGEAVVAVQLAPES
jgi:hypothetical protein